MAKFPRQTIVHYKSRYEWTAASLLLDTNGPSHGPYGFISGRPTRPCTLSWNGVGGGGGNNGVHIA